MAKITFRSITPVFDFALEPEGSVFSHSGNYENADYEIELKRFPQGPESFDELMKYAKDKDRHTRIHLPPGLGQPTDYFLVIDVTHDPTKLPEKSSNSNESLEVRRCILDALRLVSSKGLRTHRSYNFTSNVDLFEGRSSPLMPQYLFTHIGQPSVLQESNFNECCSVFDKLLTNNTPDPKLDLALAYHMTSFGLQRVEHCFLILMIIFEALYKQKDEENIEKAARRISEVLGDTCDDQTRVKDEFTGTTNSFGQLRNDIAHGDTNLDIATVKMKYPILYDHITRAIIHHIG